MRSADELIAIAEEGLRICRRVGATAAEVYVKATESTSITAVGAYAQPTEAFDEGVAVRVADGPRLGQSGSTGMSAATIERVARHALDAARRVPDSTRFQRFAPPRDLPPPTRIHPALEQNDPKRVSLDLEAAADALAGSPGVTYTGASLHSWRTRWAVANTEGVRAWDQHAGERMQLEVRVTRASVDRTAQGARGADRPISDAMDVRAFAAEVASRAASALDARPLDAPADEIILAPSPATQLLALFTPAFSAKRVRAKQTPLAGRLGERVAHELLTIRDAPRGPAGIHHARVDAEGSPTENLALVEAGVARSFLYDHDSALAEGRASTGHGVRSGVTGGVGIKPHNLDVAPGDRSLDELIEGARRAVLVNEPMMGGFVANETTGDFSLVAPFAFLVENGRIRHALPPTTVGGNVHRALEEVRAVGRERVASMIGTYPHLHLGGVSCAT